MSRVAWDRLEELERAGLVRGVRRQRQVLYAVGCAGARELLEFLVRDCCQGDPEICRVVADTAGCGRTAAVSRVEALDG